MRRANFCTFSGEGAINTASLIGLPVSFLRPTPITEIVTPWKIVKSASPGPFLKRVRNNAMTVQQDSLLKKKARQSAKPCQIGVFNAVEGADTLDQCLPSPSGTFSEEEGATQCKSCAKGPLFRSWKLNIYRQESLWYRRDSSRFFLQLHFWMIQQQQHVLIVLLVRTVELEVQWRVQSVLLVPLEVLPVNRSAQLVQRGFSTTNLEQLRLLPTYH